MDGDWSEPGVWETDPGPMSGLHPAEVFFGLFLVVMVVVAIVMALAVLRMAGEGKRRQREFRVASGQVLEIEPVWVTRGVGDDRRSSKRYKVRCAYSVGDGREVTGWSDDSYPGRDWSVGSQTQLWFDPARPDLFVLKQPSPQWFGLAFMLSFLAVFVGVVLSIAVSSYRMGI